jgi:hypothetical protein
VIGAAQPVFLVAAKKQVGAAMRAQPVDQSNAARGVAEGHQPLAQQGNPHRVAIRTWQILAQQHRNPVASQQLAHRRALAHPRQTFILLFW